MRTRSEDKLYFVNDDVDNQPAKKSLVRRFAGFVGSLFKNNWKAAVAAAVMSLLVAGLLVGTVALLAAFPPAALAAFVGTAVTALAGFTIGGVAIGGMALFGASAVFTTLGVTSVVGQAALLAAAPALLVGAVAFVPAFGMAKLLGRLFSGRGKVVADGVHIEESTDIENGSENDSDNDLDNGSNNPYYKDDFQTVESTDKQALPESTPPASAPQEEGTNHSLEENVVEAGTPTIGM